MRWTTPFRVDPRLIIDKYHLYERTLNRNRAKMRAAGTPCTYYRNSAITLYGTAPDDLTKCYCWSKTEDAETKEIKSSPNRDHFLCMGTGYLQGYTKYGYHHIVVSTPSDISFSSNSISVGQDQSGEPDRFSMSSASSTEEYLDTENFTLDSFKEVDFFLAKDKTDADTNRIKYYYSTDDGGNWTELTMEDYTDTELGNRKATGFSLPEGTTQIKFRATFQKRYAASPSPQLNSIRFRYRYHVKITELDPRHTIDIPAFLASRDQVKIEINQSEHGWKTTRPMRWWTLPEANISEGDIIVFLQGEFEGQKYEVKNLTEHTHGPELKILHRDFESAFLRDNYDIIRILNLLI